MSSLMRSHDCDLFCRSAIVRKSPDYRMFGCYGLGIVRDEHDDVFVCIHVIVTLCLSTSASAAPQRMIGF